MHDHPHSIGIDLGGTFVKMVAISAHGETLQQTQFTTNDSELAEWAIAVKSQLDQWQSSIGDPYSIGVASPGIVSLDHRSVTWMQGRMESTCGFDWTTYLASNHLIPVLNDAKAALLAEAWLGAARGARNAILLTLGTGVGGAALVDGRLLHGATGRAGHLGHISLDPYGAPDIVGTPGSLEDHVGGVTLLERSSGKYRSTESLVADAIRGVPEAKRIWHASIRTLAAGIVSLINVLDPEVVILGGGITNAGPEIFTPLAEAMAPMEWCPLGRRIPVVPADLGELAGAIGAARFAATHRTEHT